MTYKSLLVHVDPGAAQVAALRSAVDLADAFDASVLGLGAEAIAPLGVVVDGGYAAAEAAWINARREQITQNLKSAEAHFRRAIGARPHEWRTTWSPPTEAVAQVSRAADLIVIGKGRPGPVDPSRAVNVGQLVVTAGRPVLLCPSAAERLPPRSALVAWKDTRESRRALADALPLLKRADDVVILEVCSDADAGCATARTLDIVSALARHGVSARPRTAVKSASTGEAILETADRLGSALIVAGGYGHSRLGEWVFGGVTRTLLEQDRRFVLFSH